MGVSRAETLEELSGRTVDLLVIGGGIVGAGIAAAAGRAGLAVALVERGDFGAATTSASSKLIHGGLRYLRLGDVRLVREAHAERLALMRRAAPHLVRPQPFLLPVYEKGPYGPLALRAGLIAYAALAGFRDGAARMVRPESARARIPQLRLDGLQGCGLYSDAQTHDSRLCLANVRTAAGAGAHVLNYADVVDLRLAKGRVVGADVRDRVKGDVFAVSARAVVNATGPWVDAVRRLEDPRAGTRVMLSKGVHVVVDLPEAWSAALVVPLDRVRVSFAVPWEGLLLLGTTDAPFDGDPDWVEATDEDLEQVMTDAGVALDDGVARRERVVSSFAGLRVLPVGKNETARARREAVLVRGRGGMLTIAGGKLTTYRRIALDVLSELRSELGLRMIDAQATALAGAAWPETVAASLRQGHRDLDPETCAYLAHLYGSLADEMLAPTREEPELLAPIHPGGPDVLAQARYAGSHEWALSAEDVLKRRTTVHVRGHATPEVASRVAGLLNPQTADGSIGWGKSSSKFRST